MSATGLIGTVTFTKVRFKAYINWSCAMEVPSNRAPRLVALLDRVFWEHPHSVAAKSISTIPTGFSLSFHTSLSQKCSLNKARRNSHRKYFIFDSRGRDESFEGVTPCSACSAEIVPFKSNPRAKESISMSQILGSRSRS